MPLNSHDKDSASSNTLTKIGRATGIDNFSSSSKLRLISEALHEDIGNFIEVVKEGVLNTYPEFAEGSYLSVKGAEYGVYRDNISSYIVKEDEDIVRLVPKGNKGNFSSHFDTPILIEAGNSFTVSNQIKIVLLSDVFIDPHSTNIPVSAKIEPLSDSGLNVSEGDIFNLPFTNNGLGEYAPYIQIYFNSAIQLNLKDETEEDFRERILFARDNSTHGTVQAIHNIIPKIPSVYGFSFIENSRGPGTADIGITTESYEKTTKDPSITFVVKLFQQYLEEIEAYGYDIEVFIPNPVYTLIKYENNNPDISDQVISDTITRLFYNNYKYSNSNSLDLKSLELQIKSSVSALSDFILKEASILDPAIDEITQTSSEVLSVPTDKYLVLTPDNIQRNV